jgi:hypothetical protein
MRGLPYVRQRTGEFAGPGARMSSSAQNSAGARGIIAASRQRNAGMLFTIAVVLVVLWFLGLVTANTLGGLIHALLLIAVIILLVRVISGRNAL